MPKALEKLLTARRELSRTEIDVLRQVAREYLHFFCVFGCGYDRVTPVGGSHWKLCRKVTPPVRKPLMVMCNRGWFKSTIMSVGRPLWMGCRHPEDFDFISIVDDESLGASHLETIARHVEANETLHLLFPEVRPGKPWTSQDASYRLSARATSKTGPTWGMRTFRQPTSGRHVWSLMYDDPVNDENWKNRNRQEDIAKKFDLQWPTVDSDEIFFAVTPYADYDFVMHVVRNLAPDDVELFLQPVKGRCWLTEDNVIEWEDGPFGDTWAWDEHRLAETRRKIKDPAIMSSQYFLQTRTKTAASFQLDWIKHRKKTWLTELSPTHGVPLHPYTAYLAGDSASGKGKSRLALVAGGVHENGEIGVFETRLPKDPTEFVESFFEMAKKWNVFVAGCERYGQGGHGVWDSLQDHMRRTGEYILLEPLTGGGDKDNRIWTTLWPQYQNGRVYHLDHLIGGELEDELDSFGPRARYKDLVDAETWLFHVIMKFRYTGPRHTHEAPPPFTPQGNVGYTLDELRNPKRVIEEFFHHAKKAGSV